MLRKLPGSSGRTLGFEASGWLVDADYQRLLFPELESAIRDHRPMRLLLAMRDFRGWTLPAAWDDLQIGLKYNQDIERIAIVGDRPWEKWLARLGVSSSAARSNSSIADRPMQPGGGWGPDPSLVSGRSYLPVRWPSLRWCLSQVRAATFSALSLICSCTLLLGTAPLRLNRSAEGGQGGSITCRS